MNDDEMDRTQKLSRDSIPTRAIPFVCSWCKRIYSIEQWRFQENERTGVSHGICPECLASMHGQLSEEDDSSSDFISYDECAEQSDNDEEGPVHE